MSGYVIEDGVPVPRAKAGRNPSSLTAALRAMGVGQSVLVADKEQRSLACYWGRLRPKKFVSRNVEGGVRIWRVE